LLGRLEAFLGRVPVAPERVAVEPAEPDARREPDEAGAVLGDAVVPRGGEVLLLPEVVEVGVRLLAHGHGREREGEGKSHIPEKPRSFAAGRAARASSLAGRLRPGHGPLRLHLPSHPRRPGALVSPGADPDSVVPGIM